jgi:exopolysaccharide biosynthesis protein
MKRNRFTPGLLTALLMASMLNVLIFPVAATASPSVANPLAANPSAPGPATIANQPGPTAFAEGVRYHLDKDVFRLVFEMTAIPPYTVSLEDVPLQVVIELPDTVNRGIPAQMSFNDPFIDKMNLVNLGGGRFKAVIALKMPVLPKVSLLSSPTRLVVDLLKTYKSETVQTLAPGLTYREFVRGRAEGPVKAHLLEIDPREGYELRPVLSNDSVAGIEPLSEMASRTGAAAMVNGPYYMRNGEILGLMKIDRTLVSTSDTLRTTFGILPDGKMIFDSPEYEGYIELPDKSRLPIEGLNRSRGQSDLVLYNSYFAFWTLTQSGGQEYIVKDGKIVEIRSHNTVIPEGGAVLSASGRPAFMMAHLKPGDSLNIVQTLGSTWDTVVQAVSAGPRLIKNGEIFVTTIGEEFGSDVAGGRAPRTAIGVTREGKVLLLVVDGRRRTSVGFTLLQLAQFMLEMGAVEAMNLDGGGSSQMMIGNRIVNLPSDGRERRLGAGIAVMKKKTNP